MEQSGGKKSSSSDSLHSDEHHSEDESKRSRKHQLELDPLTAAGSRRRLSSKRKNRSEGSFGDPDEEPQLEDDRLNP